MDPAQQSVLSVPACPARPADGHKGTFGTVIVVGGSATMPGAPAMAASAALRAGAGLAKIAAAADVLSTALAIEPGATGIAIKAGGSIARAMEQADAERHAVLAVGPGMGRTGAAGRWVAALLRQPRTVVLDADGLNLLAATRRPRPAGGGTPRVVMTPHPGEFARLAAPLRISASPVDESQRPAAAAGLADAHRAVVVLKGPRTVVSDGERTYFNATGNVALATAGTGDVLTGLIAGLIAQGMSLFDAAVLGVYVHGLAADLWAQQHGASGLLARELAGLIPDAMEARRRGV